MQFEGRRRISRVPNLTPLIDIVFLLLVFFMLTSHFVRDDALQIDLPDASSALSLDNKQQVIVTIDAFSQVMVDGYEVSLDTLDASLAKALNQTTDKVVRIRGDQGSSLGLTVTVLDAANKAGASGVDIVTEKQ